ncbi:EpsG family protein [Chryseobacterium sp. cx-311]|uniref:EpsG family protein n=1 Tax=Marnyiella aurantia TaxID=2758037 RepID=UPI001AE925AB|nr:EpsG family protein [Marnyiella aurantia]MBP0612949.1 EpsG family protein [Marnyiella aurantia]
MFDFIPLPYYTAIYHHALFFIACVILLQSLALDIRDTRTVDTGRGLGYIILLFTVLYMGLRPVSGYYFMDMANYNNIFIRIQQGEDLSIKSDYLFNYFTRYSAKIMTVKQYFLLITVLYTVPCYIFARKYFGSYWFFSFFMFVGSFSFWAYGTNGLRNGLATATFLLALTYYRNLPLRYGLMALAFGFHSSMVIPIAAFLAAAIVRDPRKYLWIWLASVPVSLVMGNTLQTLFAGFYADDRALDYLTKGNVNNDQFSSTGFRWDFVLYSAAAVYAGWYYIFKKNITDRFYVHLFGTYVIANAFWILVIRANFSNRFAYLSWFLMAAVIAYPMLRYKLWNDQFKTAGLILFVYYFFTYFMFLRT